MYSRWLAATALAYSVLHHLGLVPDGLGTTLDATRWTDWLDLAVPWLVLAPGAVTLHAARAPMRHWVLFAAGVVAYTSGHGIHLAANSVGNEDPGPTAHLWDEVVGHHLWYAGVALVLAALALTMRDRPRPHPVGHLLSLAVGLTWASNAIGGGTEVLSLLVAIAVCAFGWAHRKDLAVVLLVGFLPAVGVLVVALAGSLS
ncbi:phosphatidylglycerophosphatase A [Nocardioides ginsengisegetis]|uniref:Phosphatidylglycerophosphatase A n=1 Tax=Nocardioides ginsengisegetis TaxID=661491 RepID=A0A7W3IY10_9ACTN|nr:hypothetical protein [Nocardioides ginsengisegetis]MBA8802742.1 phosphatidylglycerophosphatase A [Nocardioides ginsengisegetis]